MVKILMIKPEIKKMIEVLIAIELIFLTYNLVSDQL